MQTAASVEVTAVDFAQVRYEGLPEAWLECAVELRAVAAGSGPRAATHFAGPLTVRLSLAFRSGAESAAGPRTYRAEAEVLALQAGEPRTVFFYLPPVEVERHQLRDRPYAWLVELVVDGVPLPPTGRALSATLQGGERLANFRRAVEAAPRAGTLQPLYLTPFFADEERQRPSPAYRRR